MSVLRRTNSQMLSHERAYLAVDIWPGDNERPYPVELFLDYVHGSLTPTGDIVRGAA